jgi:PAS domain-containing protein
MMEEVTEGRGRCIVEADGGPMTDWTEEFPGGVTVCDRHGVITQMNDKSARIFEADGGRALVGRNLLDCHPEPSRSLVADLLANPRVNAYTIEKRGLRKLIYQAPWYCDGNFQGLVELSLEIPESLPHFVREG